MSSLLASDVAFWGRRVFQGRVEREWDQRRFSLLCKAFPTYSLLPSCLVCGLPKSIQLTTVGCRILDQGDFSGLICVMLSSFFSPHPETFLRKLFIFPLELRIFANDALSICFLQFYCIMQCFYFFKCMLLQWRERQKCFKCTHQPMPRLSDALGTACQDLIQEEATGQLYGASTGLIRIDGKTREKMQQCSLPMSGEVDPRVAWN